MNSAKGDIKMTEKIKISCEAEYSEDKTHRFTWKRVWDSKKPVLCVITLNPGSSDVFELDLTSMLVTNNAYRLKDFGGVIVVNLFSVITEKLNAEDIRTQYKYDERNMQTILNVASEAEKVVIAWGKSGNTNKHIHEKEEKILEALIKYIDKLCLIADYNGVEGLHPLTPSIRSGWELVPFLKNRGEA